MRKRLSILGIVLAVVGLGFVAGGGYAYLRIQDGYDSLQAFSEAQNVTLSYDESGQLLDRGQPEGAQAILSLLRDDWQYPVVESDLDPNDPLVNTATEYMYQMATIIHHVVDGTVQVTLDETVEYNGETFEAGTYDVAVDGRYWTGFDRMHPLEGPARELAWTGTVHGLVGELGVGTVTHSTLQMGLGLSVLLGGLGVTFMLIGFGLAWAARAKQETDVVSVPDTIPQAMVDEHATPGAVTG
ncbi:MAG TPA: hypothetical protein VK853_04670 [Ilumatobacteraceae bacterium]|nr:hypothetical protein [Ilumatobacteraceae bacterium]